MRGGRKERGNEETTTTATSFFFFFTASALFSSSSSLLYTSHCSIGGSQSVTNKGAAILVYTKLRRKKKTERDLSCW